MQQAKEIEANRHTIRPLGEENYRYFPAVKRLIEKHAPTALRKLYAAIASSPVTAKILPTEVMRNRASSAQLAHWKAMFSSQFDSAAIGRSQKIGRIHSDVGLTPNIYISAYASVLEDIIVATLKNSVVTPLNGKRVGGTIAALVKAALTDMECALGAYFDAEAHDREVVISRMSAALERVATGDLRADMTDLPPAYSELGARFHKMRYEISSLVVQMMDSAESVKTGASEISSAANDLAQRTESQAATTSRIADVMRDLTSAIGTSARLAKEVDDSVSEQTSHATHGGEIMSDAVVAMDKIEKSAAEISSIIEVIDGIAFQTNLLALNAGVEAARAGEAGKGFAVVASEVRALAQRTTESASLIKELVATSSVNVQEGVKLVGQTRVSLEKIIEGLSETSTKAAEISQFAQGQVTNMEGVSTQIQQIDVSTQQNAAMVEQSNAAAASLSDQAFKMATIIEHFSFERRTRLRDPNDKSGANMRRGQVAASASEDLYVPVSSAA